MTVPTSVPAGLGDSGSGAGMVGLIAVALALLAGAATLIRHRVFNA